MTAKTTTEPARPTRVALYLRVSTDEQAREGYSLEAQRTVSGNFARAKCWTLVHEYVDDGFSARSTNRPGYRQMMDEPETWDVVLVHKMDRSHRNLRNFMAMMDELADSGKGFCSVTEMLDTTTAHGRFFMDMLQRMAQLESEVIADRVRVGMAQKAQTEKCWLGTPPFGYELVDGNLVVGKQGEWVLWMYKQHADGIGLAAIRQALEDLHVSGARGGDWTLGRVRETLTNPAYLGLRMFRGKGIPNHDAIVSPDLFRCVQERLASRAKTRVYALPQTTGLALETEAT